MPDIKTLIPDIQSLLSSGKDFSPEALDALGEQFKALIKDRLQPRKPREGVLRMSNFGAPDRQLWYQVNKPEKAEPLPPEAYLKFLYGDIIELLVLFLAKEAGHTVTHQQAEVEVGGVKGHPDAVIDGVLVDVKSASGYGMQKFERHELEKNDPFNYLYQISLYLEALKDDKALGVKKEGSFLAVDKSSGKLALDTYKKKNVDFLGEVEDKKKMLHGELPPRCHEPEPDGMSGNKKLSVPCSYCSFKKECWPEMRTFAYSNGPRHLVVVKKVPDVPEVK